MEARRLTNSSQDEPKKNERELSQQELRSSIGFSGGFAKFKSNNIKNNVDKILIDEKNSINTKKDAKTQDLITTNSSLRQFDSLRSSCSTNYSINDSLKTFKEDSRITSDFGEIVENNNSINKVSNIRETFKYGSNICNLSNNLINTNNFVKLESNVTKISNISKFSEPSSGSKITDETPLSNFRGSMGMFNKQTRNLVGAEDFPKERELYNSINKCAVSTTSLSKSLKVEEKPNNNILIDIEKTEIDIFRKSKKVENAVISEKNYIDISEIEQTPQPKLIKTDKYTYRGYVNKLNKREGFGICIFSNGDKYTGYWKDDKKEGWGRYEFIISEKIFQGEFKNSHVDGFVEFINKNGVTHQGYMKNLKFFNNEVMTIMHSKYELNGVMEYNSEINKLTGVGSIQYKNGAYYEGETLEGHEHGWGITKKLDNTIFRGLKEENNYNSYCEVIYPNNDKYFGWFQNNKKHGLGIVITQDGTYSLGKYFQDLKDGGFIYLAKGEAKFELHLFGFLTKTIEKKENIISYLNLVYPEYKWLIKANNKVLYKKLAVS